jgi:hypothetical protein
LRVEIDGYNLGDSLDDVTIKVAGQLCTSVVHTSAHRVSCLIVLTEPNLLYATLGNDRARVPPYVSSISEQSSEDELSISIVPYSVTDVELITAGGRTQGVNAKPLTTVRSGSGRPTMSHIVLRMLPFEPYTITLATHREETAGGAVSLVQTLYWSNTAYGAHSIQRSRLDGSQVETVVSNVSSYPYLRTVLF